MSAKSTDDQDLGVRVQERLRLTAPPPPALAKRLAAGLTGGSAAGCEDGTPLGDVAWAVLDLETTGASPAIAEILEIGVRLVRAERVVERFDRLVHPCGPIPAEITALTGIDASLVADAPGLDEVLAEVAPLLRGTVIVAHQASFDTAFLDRAFTHRGDAPLGNPVLCTRQLARRLRPDLPRRSLDDLCAAYDIPIRGRHRAGGDAEATAHLLVELIRRAQAQGVATLGALRELVARQPAPAVDFSAYGFGPAFLDHLPPAPGVYRMLDRSGEVIYVGKARNLHERVRSYFIGRGRGKVQALREALYDLEIVATPSELEALMLEAAEIQALRPVFNVQVQVRRRAFFLKIGGRGRRRRVVAATTPPASDDREVFGPLHLGAGPRETARRVRLALEIAAQAHDRTIDPAACLGGEEAAAVLEAISYALANRVAAGEDREAEEIRQVLVTLRKVLAVSAPGRCEASRRDLLVRLPSSGPVRLFLVRDGYPAQLLACPPEGDAEAVATRVEALLAEPRPSPGAAAGPELALLDDWLSRHRGGAVLDLGDVQGPSDLRARLRTLLGGPAPPDLRLLA